LEGVVTENLIKSSADMAKGSLLMKILITGNMGYIGPLVVDQLRQTYPDATLVGLDLGFFATCLTNSPTLPESNLDIQYFHDIRNFTKAQLDGVDAIVNLAAISNDPMGNTFEDVTLQVNYEAGVELAKTAKQMGVKRFVFASSCSMYGSADGAPKTEDSSLNPLTAYARSKVFTEKALKEIADENFIVTCLRFSTACGMSPRLRLDLVLNDFVAAAISSGEITILSDGTPWRPLINVKDMAMAIDWAIGRDAATGGNCLSVNVGSNEWNYQVRDLAEAVASVMPGVEVSINKDAMPDKRSYRVSFDLFKKLAPHHQPQCSLTDSIEELRDGLKAMGFSDTRFRESNLIRLKVLNQLRADGLLGENLSWKKKI
jgi:nucleoside-diphosphate-sugar epimerase